MSRDRYRTSCVVFVGNLPGDMTEGELEEALGKFGRVIRVELKTPPRPPAFAFVEFEKQRSADEAVRKGDIEFRGTTLRIELARGGPQSMSSYSRGRNSRSPYRVLVKGLPPSASWQDVKDHFRKVVDPTFAKVYSDRDRLYGIVEFDSYEDLKYAIRKLDDTEFRNRYDRAYIRVIDDSERSPSSSSYTGSSYSKSRSASRSRSRSSKRRHSYSRSRSPSRSKSSRSRSRSRSYSYSNKSYSRSPTPDKGKAPKDKPQEDGKSNPKAETRSYSSERSR